MRQSGNPLFVNVLLCAMCLLWPISAHAYLDPTTGDYNVQILLAMLVLLGVGVKHYWNRLAALVGRIFSRKADQMPELDSRD